MRFGEADLGSCDREPIHIPGSIQPHGALLALDPDTLQVVQVAGDSQHYFGFSSLAMIGQNVEAHIGASARLRLQAQFAGGGPATGSSLAFEVEILGRPIDATAYPQDGLVILELEPQRAVPADDVLDLLQRGFGRTLLERVFAEDVSGKVLLAMEPDGVRCTIDIPLEKVVGHASTTKTVEETGKLVHSVKPLALSGVSFHALLRTLMPETCIVDAAGTEFVAPLVSRTRG